MSYTDVFGDNTVPPADYSYASFNLTTNTTVVWPFNATGDNTLAKINEVTCSAGVILTMPDATQVSVGQDLLVRNVGSNTLQINRADNTVLTTIAPGAVDYIYLTDNTSLAGVYTTVAFGSSVSEVSAAALVGYGIKAIGASLNQSHPAFPFASDYTIPVNGRAKLFINTGGAVTLTLPAAATAGDDFFFLVRNNGTGTLTIDPNGSETIDTQTTLNIQPSESMFVLCDGSAWYSVGFGRSTIYQFSQLVKDVTAGGTITLTAAEASNKLITFIGSPAADLTVVVPTVVSLYYVSSEISTAQSILVKTSGGTGVSLAQSDRTILMCDGADVVPAIAAAANTALSLANGSAAAPSLNFASQTNTGLYKYGASGIGVAVEGVSALTVDTTNITFNKELSPAVFDPQPAAPAHQEGKVFYDDATHSLCYYNEATAVTVNLGQEEVVRVRNNTGSTVTDGTAVYINGATGNHPTVARAQANSEATSTGTIGVATHDIVNNADGYITTSGLVRGINTSSFATGAALYLSPSVAGGITTTKPSSPDHTVLLGYCVYQHAVNGIIYVHVQNGYELDELHDVKITGLANGNLLQYDSVLGYWKNAVPPAGSLVGTTATQTLTNKTITLGDNTVSGTVAQFNSALTDGDFATLAGAETLTNKTVALGSNTVSGTKAEFDAACTDGNFGFLGAAQTWTGEQTFTETKETTYSLTGTAIDPANGSIQYKTLSGNTTFTESLESGQSVTLMLDYSTFTPTWPTTTWIGGAPVKETSGYTLIVFWKVGSTLYGAGGK